MSERPPRYKFVELSIVTSETLEEAVNEWVQQGWSFDGVRFVTTEASRRPAMAFLSFVRADDGAAADPPAPAADDEGTGDIPPDAPATAAASPSPSTRRRRR